MYAVILQDEMVGIQLHNLCCSVENMGSIVKATHLSKITVDGNPVSLGRECMSFPVSYLPSLKPLSCMEVTESVQKPAIVWQNTKETLMRMSQHGTEETCTDMRREEVISNAKTKLGTLTFADTLFVQFHSE